MAGRRKKQGEQAGSGAPGEADASAEVAVEARRLLTRAMKLVAEPSAWTRREFARDRHSHRVSPSSERAVRFCVGGALLRATSERFGVQFKLGEPPDPFPDEPWVAALDLAYRYFGNALVRLHLWANVASLHEELVAGVWEVKLTLQPSAGPTGEKTIEARWSEVVHIFNDHRAVKHPSVLLALLVAQAATFAETLLGVANRPEGDQP